MIWKDRWKIASLWLLGGALIYTAVQPVWASGERLDRPEDGVLMERLTDHCPALSPPTGEILYVSTVGELVSAVNHATGGETISLADGYYALNGAHLRLDVPGLSLRSTSGNRENVILDGGYLTMEIIQIVASDVTVADLTLQRAYNHPIHVSNNTDPGAVPGDVTGTLLYNLHIIDPGQQAIKINPDPGQSATYFVDDGVIACSHIALTDAGRERIRGNCYTGGVDAHQAQGWTIRDNLIEGFWCDFGLSEHGIHMWRGCKDTLITRNDLRNNARGIGLGLVESGTGYRTYPGFTCPNETIGYVDDFGGLVTNNIISAFEPDLFSSQFGFDCGICFWNACDSKAYHNTIYTDDPGNTFSGMEWRFVNTQALVYNNLSNAILREREGASAVLEGNLSQAAALWFVNPSAYDFHLALSATQAIDQGVTVSSVWEDFEGDPRPVGDGPDVGADEVYNFAATDWVYLPFLGR